MFSLVVNNFGIKYTQKADADHLIKYLREDYEITEDWTGEKYLGLTLKWDYVNINVYPCRDTLKQPYSSSNARPPPNPKIPYTGVTIPYMAPKLSMPTPKNQTQWTQSPNYTYNKSVELSYTTP